MTFYQIAKNTVRESLREPIFYLLLVCSLVLIGFSPLMAMFVFREQIKLVTDSGLATTLVFGLICSVLCAGHTVTREMKNGTVLLLLSKPVPRWSFIIAKIAGIMMAMFVFVCTCEAAILISLRVAKDQFELDFKLFYIFFGLIAAASIYGAIRNYLHHKAFASSAAIGLFFLFISAATIIYSLIPANEDPEEPILGFKMIVPAFVLLIFAVWIMVALTVALSTRLEMVANLTLISLIFFLGLVSDYFFGTYVNTISLQAFLYAILPNWQLFWLADALASKKYIPLEYLLLAGIYTATYISFISFIAVLFFREKEAGAQSR